MKRSTIAVAIASGVLLACALAFAAYRLGARSAAVPAQDTPTTTAQAGRRVLYWRDPMVPDKRFERPGKSPFMDMDLVPVYADEQDGTAAVTVAPGMRQNLGLRLATVHRGSIGASLRLVGNVAFDERQRVVMQARGTGFVERLYVRAPLEPVRRGQAMLELYVPDWVAAQEDYLAVRRMGANPAAAGLLEAARERMRLAGMSEAQIGQVAERGRLLRNITLVAPRAGVVAELAAREGMTVAPGTALFTIAGLDSVWVNAEVPESAAAQVRPGSRVSAHSSAYPDSEFAGKVQALLPQVDPATRTMTARIELDNRGGKLAPGMFVSVSLSAAQARQALLLPAEAVIQTGKRSVVIVALPGGGFAPAEVRTGAEADGVSEILAGLREGQQVVVSGQFLIDSEASLRGALQRLGEPAPTVPAPAATATPAAPAAAAIHHATGTVEKIAPDEITISHAPVASLQWPAMTMGFVPPAAGIPHGTAVGDTVRFDIRKRGDGRYQIVSMARVQAPAHGSGHGAEHGQGERP